MSRHQVKSMAVIMGGAALVAAGALSASLAPSGGVIEAKTSSMNVGATSTMTTPPATPSIAEAVPAIKGPAPLWAGESP